MVLASVTIHFGCAPQIGHATPTTQQKVQITRTFSRQVSQVETDTGTGTFKNLSARCAVLRKFRFELSQCDLSSLHAQTVEDNEKCK
jgi:hypothetical protein